MKKSKYIFLALILAVSFAFAAEPDPGVYPPWYKLKAYIQDGVFSSTGVTIDGDITLENDEKITNETDAELEFKFNDDAANLGDFIISTSIGTSGLAANDYWEVLFRAVDGGANETDYAEIEVSIEDTTGGTEDSEMVIKLLQAGGSVSPLTLTGDNATFADDLDVGGSVTMENDEQFLNSTNAEVEIQFNDDADTLGSVIVNSSMTKSEIAPNDIYELIFRSVDGLDNETDYAEFEVALVDTTDGSEDSEVAIKTLNAGSSLKLVTMESNAFQVNGSFCYGLDSSSVNDSYGFVDTDITAYTTGMLVYMSAAVANTGACTIQINALGQKSIKMLHDQDPADNYIEDGSIVQLMYDGTNFQLLSPDANP